MLSKQSGSLRTIYLNRPSALNALNTRMVRLIRKYLQEATSSSSSSSPIIALRGEGRALCSGGDVLAVVKAANAETEEQRQEALAFFQGEFELDYMIAKLGERSGKAVADAGSQSDKNSKVFISFMDGITSECSSTRG